MKEDISALMDGEVNEQEMQQSLREMRNDPEQRDCWEQYHIIGDALKNNLPSNLNRDFVNNISQAIANEDLPAPEITPPKQKTINTAKRRHPIANPFTGFALAASVAMVAYVGVGMIAVDEQAAGSRMASAPTVVAPPAQQYASNPSLQSGVQTVQGQQWNTKKPALESKLNNYLYSHRNVAGAGRPAVIPHARLVVSRPVNGG